MTSSKFPKPVLGYEDYPAESSVFIFALMNPHKIWYLKCARNFALVHQNILPSNMIFYNPFDVFGVET